METRCDCANISELWTDENMIFEKFTVGMRKETEILYRMYGKTIRAIAYQYLKDEDLAEDCLQEVMLRLSTVLDRIRRIWLAGGKRLYQRHRKEYSHRHAAGTSAGNGEPAERGAGRGDREAERRGSILYPRRRIFRGDTQLPRQAGCTGQTDHLSALRQTYEIQRYRESPSSQQDQYRAARQPRTQTSGADHSRRKGERRRLNARDPFADAADVLSRTPFAGNRTSMMLRAIRPRFGASQLHAHTYEASCQRNKRTNNVVPLSLR